MENVHLGTILAHKKVCDSVITGLSIKYSPFQRQNPGNSAGCKQGPFQKTVHIFHCLFWLILCNSLEYWNSSQLGWNLLDKHFIWKKAHKTCFVVHAIYVQNLKFEIFLHLEIYNKVVSWSQETIPGTIEYTVFIKAKLLI